MPRITAFARHGDIEKIGSIWRARDARTASWTGDFPDVSINAAT